MFLLYLDIGIYLFLMFNTNFELLFMVWLYKMLEEWDTLMNILFTAPPTLSSITLFVTCASQWEDGFLSKVDWELFGNQLRRFQALINLRLEVRPDFQRVSELGIPSECRENIVRSLSWLEVKGALH